MFKNDLNIVIQAQLAKQIIQQHGKPGHYFVHIKLIDSVTKSNLKYCSDRFHKTVALTMSFAN